MRACVLEMECAWTPESASAILGGGDPDVAAFRAPTFVTAAESAITMEHASALTDILERTVVT